MKNFKSKLWSILLVGFVLAFALTACSPGNSSETQQSETQQSNTQSNNQSNTGSNTGSENHSNTRKTGKEQTAVRVASLLGPTGMGMVKLMADQGEADLAYEFSLAASPDDLVAKVINKEIDIAALPTNLALLLYNKTEGQIQLAAINTLGVLYLVENGESIKSVADLKGKEVYISGKGTTPDFVMQYLLKHHGLEVGKDVQLDYFTQHSDLAAALAGGDVAIGLLPQPHVTTAMLKNQDLKIALDLTKEWEQAAPQGGQLPMGCLVVQKEFAENNQEALNTFLAEYKESVSFVNKNVEQAAQLMEQYGILPKAQIAQKALPYCNIVFIDAQAGKTDLEEYYQVLYDFEPSSIGGKLADEGFYYNKK